MKNENGIKNGNGNEHFFYFTADDPIRKGNFLIFTSEKYKLTEQEVLNLLKVIFVDRRYVAVGRRLFDAYQFFGKGKYSEKELNEKLEKIGIQKTKNDRQFTNSRQKDKRI